MPEPSTSLTFTCLLGLAFGAITQKLGIHALFGFFLAGVTVGQAANLSEKTRQVISQMVYAIFVPLFFAAIGLKIDFLANFKVSIVLFITVVAIFGKFLGAWLGTTFSSVPKEDRLTIAIAHTPGGAMEIVIATLALEYHLISQQIYVAVVFCAVVSSVLVGPWLNFAIKRYKKVSIFDFFSPQAVIPDLSPASKQEAIRVLCSYAAKFQHQYIDEKIIYKSVIDRENSMGTGMEEAIAIPHARIPGLLRPSVVFARSDAGIEWDSPDGKPAKLIFLILTPADNDLAQLQILGAVAEAMTDKNNQTRLLEAATAQDIWEFLQSMLGQKQITRN